jgi:phosphoribosylamine---glycine ligase
MKVLVVGGGGREHALVWKIAQSPLAPEILCAPGNPGTAEHARNVAVEANDLFRLVDLARREAVDLVVIGPEEPLCLGLADKLRAANIPTFGPSAAGARIEGSKVFAKELLERHKIPCAADRRFDRSGAAKSHLEACTTWPQVVKADGLAAGKGVFICHDARSACAAVDAIMENKLLGAAGARVVVEEFLVGEEASVLAITDGETILILEPVVDHKQVGDGDTGPNTGGMGVFSPVPALTRRIQRQIEQRIIVPAVHALRREEIEYRGVLYAGLMITEAGPRVLEFNARFGDPEAQVLVRRLKGDLLPILLATAKGELASIEPPDWDPRVSIGVVAAAEGYPGKIRKGDLVAGIEGAGNVPDAVVFQAGTARAKNGDLVTAGGRVLCVTSLGAEIGEARERAYAAYDRISFEGKFCRRDIGLRSESRAASSEAEADGTDSGPAGSWVPGGSSGRAVWKQASRPPRQPANPPARSGERGPGGGAPS